MVLQAFAVPLLLWAVWRLLDISEAADGRRGRGLILACAVAIAVPIAQLVPLPQALWTSLPGRADIPSTLAAVGLEQGWRPLSVAPRATWLSALAILPPAAMLLSTIQLGYTDRRRLALVLIIVGMACTGLGLLQVAKGPGSALRFYAITNPTEAVGFFANRNHYAALLYCLVPIIAAFCIGAVTEVPRGGSFHERRASPHLVAAAIGIVALVILVVAMAVARSRAGIGLMLAALLGIFAMAHRRPADASAVKPQAGRSSARRALSALLLVAIGLGIIFAAQSALHRLQDRFTADLLSDGRIPLARNTFDAALAFMPFGSGMGTFAHVYPAFEKATDGFTASYVNRAHNDYLELWLEAGFAGFATSILFVIWAVVRCARVWRRGMPGAGDKDDLLACAFALVLLFLLAHSGVDYPLRTTALLAVFALAAAMIMPPVGSDPYADRTPATPAAEEGGGQRSRERAQGEPGGRADHRAAEPPRGEWPAEWQTKGRRNNSDERT